MERSSRGYEHFLITRFNLRYEKRASDEWLRHRLGYFESVCLPSVRAQDAPFTWLVYLDAERSPWFEGEITRLSADHTFVPVWVEGNPTAKAFLAEVLDRTQAEYLITTRIDNDDALGNGFMRRVQEEFHSQSTEFINFTDGLQITDNGKLFLRSDPSNAFISLIERRDGAVGVYVDWHNLVSNHGPVRQITGTPMWLQAVHGQNISNTARGVRTHPRSLTENFTVNVHPAPISRPKLVAAQIASVTRLGIRVLSKPSRIKWLWQTTSARFGKG